MDIWSKIKKVLIEIVAIIGIIMCGNIFYQAFFRNINTKIILMIDKRIFLFLLSSIIVLGIVNYVNIFVFKCDKRLLKKVKYFLLLFSLLLQFIILYYIIVNKAYPKTDLAVATDSAIRMLDDYFFPKNSNLLRYTQNRFFVLILYYFYKLLVALNISAFWEMSIILNFFAVDLSALFAYLCFKNIIQEEKSLFWMVCIIVFNPFMYLWFPYYYTSILSMPFMMGAIYCCQLALFRKKGGRTYILASGILTAIAYEIRVVTFIIIIAFFLFCILNIDLKEIKKYFINILLFVIPFIASILLMQAGINMHTRNLPEDKEFPITHYIMMGLQGEGRYSAVDVEYTESFETKEEKISANIQEIKRRFGDLGTTGYVRLLEQKVGLTWAEGYDGYTDWYSEKYSFFTGVHRDVLIFYCQIYRILTFFFILIYFVSVLKNGYENDRFLIYAMALIGGIIFYALWEANAKYSVGFNFVLMILTAVGISKMPNEKYTFSGQTKLTVILIVLLQILTIADICLEGNKTQERYILCQDYRNSYIRDVNKNGGKIVQSFSVSEPFDRVMIGVKNLEEIKEHRYKFTLRNEYNDLYVTEFGGEGTIFQGAFIIFTLPKRIDVGNGNMWLEIEGIGGGRDNMEFAIENSKLDYLPGGYLYYFNEQKDMDLTFAVSLDQNRVD